MIDVGTGIVQRKAFASYTRGTDRGEGVKVDRACVISAYNSGHIYSFQSQNGKGTTTRLASPTRPHTGCNQHPNRETRTPNVVGLPSENGNRNGVKQEQS